MSWSDPCPARGPGLTHAHWRDCQPPGKHPPDSSTPFEGRVHQYYQCCHCEEVVEPAKQQEHPPGANLTPPSPGIIRDHKYIPTLAGLCQRCRNPLVAHGGLEKLDTAEAEAQAEQHGLPEVCTVNHAQLTVKRLVGDGGEVWSSCPQCGILLEPKLATGEYGGKKSGPGRGEATPRFLARVEGYVGWFKHRFGQGS